MRREVSTKSLTSKLMGREISNDHQLPLFWEVKQEVFFSLFWQEGKREIKINLQLANYYKLFPTLELILLKFFSSYLSYIFNVRHHQQLSFIRIFFWGIYLSCYIFYKSWIYPWNMLGGNCNVAAKRVAPGSSESIAHRIGKHREVQKPLLVSLHADIGLLRLLISASTKYSSCSGWDQALIIL